MPTSCPSPRKDRWESYAHVCCSAAVVVALGRNYALPLAAGLAAAAYAVLLARRYREAGRVVPWHLALGLLWALTCGATLWLRLSRGVPWWE